MAATTLAKGITSGLRAAMEKDPKVVLMGEDIGNPEPGQPGPDPGGQESELVKPARLPE